MKSTVQHEHIIPRLTALWALSESGLGGFMHAVKIPFTGFFLGGFAIIMITLIALHSHKPFTQIMKATLLVVLVKATASPQSPPMAYFAVAFQGLSGAIIFALGVNRVFAIAFGAVALFESAIQKFITATLIFGKSIWEAADALFNSIAKDLGMSHDVAFSFWLIGIYTGVYTIWGMLLGNWSYSLPASLLATKASIIEQANKLTNTQLPESKKKKGNMKLISLFFILLFIISIFLLQGNSQQAMYSITRTVAALLLLYFVLAPITKYLFATWATRQSSKRASDIKQILDALPQLRNHLSSAMQLAKLNHKGLKVYRAFVINLIVLSIYHDS
jgi:hypothetical protein